MNELKPRLANSTPLTPLTFLDRTSLVYGDCPSIIYNTTIYTWSQTRSRCLQLASSISALPIGRSEVVSVVAPNVPAIYELNFAIPMAGAVINSVNTRLNAAAISIILNHSEAKLVFVYHRLASLVLEALSLLPLGHPRPILVLITDEGDNRDNIRYGKLREFYCTYEEFIGKGNPEFDWVLPTSEWDPITLNYTSGTTSSPKGVVHSHRAAFIAALSVLADWCVPQRPIYLWTLPMFHSNGWSLTWALAAVGATNICLNHFTGSTIYTMIQSHHVTHMCGAPVVIRMLANAIPSTATPFNPPVHVLTGGAPPPTQLLTRAKSLGLEVAHAYGLTETLAPVVSCAWKPQWNILDITTRSKLKARQGVQTLALTQTNVVDLQTRAPVPRDGTTIGEIVFKGGSIMLGYLKDHETTSTCMGEDGWFRTGDLGVVHTDGYLEIKDRCKDVIISGGENISSLEIETLLFNNPMIHEVAVVAQPDEHWGETPCAFISLRDGKKTTEKELIEHCRQNMPHYMVPKRVVFRDKLPRTATGKIQKAVLREMARDMVMLPLYESRL